MVEHTLRKILDSLIREAVAAKTSIMSHARARDVPVVPRLLDFTLHLCETGYAERGIIFTLLEELVEAATIAECEQVFTWVEKNTATLGAPALFERGKLILLRTCNQLLRRMSKADNTVLCGRLLMLLANLFPLSERSGVNVNGEFHVANHTPKEDGARSLASAMPCVDGKHGHHVNTPGSADCIA